MSTRSDQQAPNGRHRTRCSVTSLLKELVEDERRSEQRFPFFRHVNVLLEDGRCVVAYSRDLSTNGIGLLHKQPVPQGKVTLEISTDTGEKAVFDAEALWCQASREGWRVSGYRFELTEEPVEAAFPESDLADDA